MDILLSSEQLSARSHTGSLETNTIFFLAVFVDMVVATAQKIVQSAEVIVLLILCFGFIFSILSVWDHRTRSPSREPTSFPLIDSFFRLSLATAICAYAIWFWYDGVDGVQRLSHDGCVPYAFLFTEVDALRGARVFFQIISTLPVFVYGAFLYGSC